MNQDRSVLLSEEDERENIIRLIDKENFKKNLSYQVLMNKFALTPYIYELNEVDPLFLHYKEIAQSSVNNFILHPFQLEILKKLSAGRNLVISAPTSFGKTASIFEYICQKKRIINKILIIVPTVALRNEYLEKINDCLDGHKIITNSNDIQNFDKFCLILTHERFVEYFSKNRMEQKSIDLLVIDEIYKLQNETNVERMYSMSLAYLTAIKVSKQFVFLGPFINSISLPDIANFEMLKYEYSPIATEMSYYSDFSIESLKQIVSNNDKTLVYFSNKKDILTTIEQFIVPNTENKNIDLLNYIEKEFDKTWLSEWSVMKALKNGIGVHFNELPSFIKEYVIDSYNNSDETMLLFSTSTLLEGVNTSTKKLIITSDKIGNSKLSDFEFWNLAGRAGRLGKYKVGNVIYYGSKDDFKKEKKYINLDNLWINNDTNLDEYEFINNNKLSNKEKQEKLELIMKKYDISVDEIKYILLPFFSKVDMLLAFFDDVFVNLLSEIRDLLNESLNSTKSNSRNIRELIFDLYIKKYKKPVGIGALPSSQFSILSDAVNMSCKTKSDKINKIIKTGREILLNHPDESDESKKEKMNNLYSYSFYIVNNFVENSYIPGINILKLIIEKSSLLTYAQYKLLNSYIFRQVDAYATMVSNDEIFETLGVLPPLISIIKTNIDFGNVKNITDLRNEVLNNKEKIIGSINNNKLYLHYFKILAKKLKV